MSKFHKLYKTKAWQALRERRLQEEPLCRMCKEKDGRDEPATVVDHIKRHHGCWMRFSDYDNTQSLCKRHHDSDKQSMEWFEALPDRAGLDGYPKDGSW